MEELDYKKLIDEGRQYLSLEIRYGKLTAVEKLSVLLSAIALVAVIVIIAAFALFYLISAVVHMLEHWVGLWGAYLIVVFFLLLLLCVVLAFKRQFIIDPITRFVTRLFLNANEDDD